MAAALLAFAATGCASAQLVFDDVEAYYAVQPNMLFREADRRPPRVGFDAGQRRRLEWSADGSGRRHRVVAEPLLLRVDGRSLRQSDARRFGTELPGELGESAGLYVNDRFLCIDGVARSASGTAVRHRMVYFVVDPFGKQARLFQLPSLFGSCTGLRMGGDGRVRFDEIGYRWAQGQDAPEGLTFREWVIDGGGFVGQSVRMRATFVEPGNVYRFRSD